MSDFSATHLCRLYADRCLERFQCLSMVVLYLHVCDFSGMPAWLHKLLRFQMHSLQCGVILRQHHRVMSVLSFWYSIPETGCSQCWWLLLWVQASFFSLCFQCKNIQVYIVLNKCTCVFFCTIFLVSLWIFSPFVYRVLYKEFEPEELLEYSCKVVCEESQHWKETCCYNIHLKSV